MKREEYIDKLIAIAKLIWKINEADEQEMRLLLEMMPDKESYRDTLTIPASPIPIDPVTPWYPNSPGEQPWIQPQIVMYGCPYPYPTTDPTYRYNSTTADCKLNEEKSEKK